MHVRLVKLFGLSMALALIAWAAGESTQTGLAQGGTTVTVCATGCNFATIQAAIDAASGGTTVQVQAGTYLENLTIRNKDGLTLKGAGADQVTLDGNGPQQQQNIIPGILILSSRNITVTGFKITNSRRGLEAQDSTLLFLEANTFQKNLGQGILLTRSQAEIKGNLVQETQFDPGTNPTLSEGIQISSSQATLLDNVVKENADCGVRASVSVAEQISTATGSGNTITGNRGGDLCGNLPLALLAQPPADGTLEQVAVPADAATIQEAVNKVRVGGTITIAAGTFKQPVEAGVVQIYKSLKIIGAGADQTVLQAPGPEWTVLNIATDQLEVTIEGLKVTGGRRGLHIGTGPMGNVALRNSKVESNGTGDLKGEGLRIVGQGAVTLDQVSVSENGADGVAVVGQTKVTVQSSTIAKNARVGINTGQFISITVEKSTISDNGGRGISVSGSSQATLEDNTINSNVTAGINLFNTTQATITNNRITGTKKDAQGNYGLGIAVQGNSKATIRNSTVSQNDSNGIVLYENTQATIQQSTITSNNYVGIRLTGNSNATIDGNTVTRNVYQGIWADGSARAQITNNQILDSRQDPAHSNCCGSGIVGRGSSQLTIQGNTISKNAESGIWIGDSAQLTIKQNTISDSNIYGVYMTGSARATIEDNTFSRNVAITINARGTSNVTITKNRITDTKTDAQGNLGRGINLWENAQATVSDNTIASSALDGVRLHDKVQVTLTNNTITGSARFGINIGDYGNVKDEAVQAEISNNTIQNNKNCGISTDSDTGIRITGHDNTISSNTGGQLCGTTSKFPEGFGGGK
ncbi:MAG: hypothetical protein A2Z21_07015 [Candidatus Fraserbacteria bacterium RBG_16_55_9]|uniref:Carbohydrate-binding/sugar hydrolysis domain-containing protein n=1 Tax=Fraserbacteria sp. (strain RBG_16_55_9) TaxID=1817864 RepID=A0A1F5UQG3_FRAXR|nr:MAG: hypothetical protein A2Z21_07015 [Candidatus Fraserbacteria bacterium RBG_16_55_9]